jgi:hypothetical protein
MPEDFGSTTTPQASVSLDELALRVRTALRAAQQSRCNALHQDLAVGDALIEAQARVSSNWKQWLRENCFLSVRTALLYQRLARHRAEIEAEIERVGELSLRAAVRLIAEPSTRNATPPKPSLVTAIKKATDEEVTEALTAYGFPSFLRTMPADWRPQIAARLRRRDEELPGSPDLRPTEILRRALGLIKNIKSDPKISPAVAASNEKEAVVALHALLTWAANNGLSVNDIAVVRSNIKHESRRHESRRRTA